MQYEEVADPPKQAVIETVTGCQLKCPSCYLGAGMISRPKKLMPWNLFCDIADQIQPYVKHVYLHLWGEPTLHPQIGDMIRRVREFATVDLATHGLTITEEIANNIKDATSLSVSIDGLDQETYEKYRVSGRLENAMRGLRILAAVKPGAVNWTWVVTKDNEHQIPAARELAKSIGVNFGAKPPYFVNEAVMHQLRPLGAEYQRYDDGGTLKANRYACREFWETIYFTPTGMTLTCCYDANGDWLTGDLSENTVMGIWNGPVYREMRRRHLAGTLNDLCETKCGMP